MSKHIFLILVLSLLMLSCNGQNNPDRVDILGYSVSDKIDREQFHYRNHMDSAVLVGDYLIDDRLTVFTWFDTIVSIFYSSVTKTEFDSLVNNFNLTLNSKPEIIDGALKNGLKVLGHVYYWNDTVTGDEISMVFDDPNSDSLNGGIMITNKRFSNEVLPNIEDDEIEIIEFDEE